MSKMSLKLKMCFGMFATTFALNAMADNKVLLTCVPKNKNATFTSVKLVADTESSSQNKSKSVLFKNTLAGKDEISTPILNVISLPVGTKIQFLNNDQMRVSLFQSNSDYALIIEPPVNGGADYEEIGTMIEFLKCNK